MKQMFIVCMTGLVFGMAGCDPTGSLPGMNTGDSGAAVSSETQQRAKRGGSDTVDSSAAPRQREALQSQRQATEEARQQADAKTQESRQPQTFKDYQTGLAITYQHPWYIVRTDWKGPIFGKDGTPYMNTALTKLTQDKSKANEPGFFHVVGESIANTLIGTFQTLTFQKKSHSPKAAEPFDVLLTKKVFPMLKVQSRYRGNDGRSIIQECIQGNVEQQPVVVCHVFEGEAVASFAMYSRDDRTLREEMFKIALSTHKPLIDGAQK